MCKSKQQKQAERTQLEAQEVQKKYGEEMLGMQKELAAEAKRRRLEQQAYLKGKIDPMIDQYLKTGFAPGERARLRTMAMEDVGRQYQAFTKGALRSLGPRYRTDAPSGTMPYIRMQLARAGAESATNALRNIETMGSQRRYQTIGMGMARANVYDPLNYYRSSVGSRPMSVQQPHIQKGFWQEIGPGLAKKAIGGVLEAAPFI